MKKIAFTFYFIVISLLLSCSNSDDESNYNNTTENSKDVIINSYSKNLAYSGDLITIKGENFPSKDISKIYLDEIEAEIINMDSKQIILKIPLVKKTIPSLNFSFGDRKITNNVLNEYNSNIAIINKSVGQWTSMESSINTGSSPLYIKDLQIKNNGRIYYNISKKTFRSLDDGITWNLWYNSSFLGDFHATDNDEGWADGFGIGKVNIGGSPTTFNTIFNPEITENYANSFPCVFVENDMKTGLVVRANRDVYKTSDGKNFNQVYFSTSIPEKTDIQRAPFKLDFNNIWNIGYINEYAMIFYCNGDNEIWNTYIFSDYPKSMANNIYFVNNKVGYISLYTFDDNPTVKMFKSTDGGSSWKLINNIPNINRDLSMVFIDESIGYVSSNNEIYLTKNGGQTWTLDYKGESNIKKLGYANDCIYALTSGNIYRKYLK